MTSTNWDVAHDINHGIGFNIACVFYFATADGKESVDKATFRSLRDTQNRMTPRRFPDREIVAEGHPRAWRRHCGFTKLTFIIFVAV